MIIRHIPGFLLAVIPDGVTVKVKGYGIAGIENTIPVKSETVFYEETENGKNQYIYENIKY